METTMMTTLSSTLISSPFSPPNRLPLLFSSSSSSKLLQLKNNSKTLKHDSVSVKALGLFGTPRGRRGGGGGGGGAGILERPNFDQSQPNFPLPQPEQGGGDIGRMKQKKVVGMGDSYRVLLLDDQRHTENLVAKLLPQAVPSVASDDARVLFQKSRENGVATVIVTVKEHAEFYATMMMRQGLQSAIEPDSNTE